MALKTVNEESLIALGDAIRARTGGTEALNFPDGMVNAINGFLVLPDSAYLLSGKLQHKFSYNCQNWLIDLYGDKITTNNITDASYMFCQCDELTNIPFDININIPKSSSVVSPMTDMFQNCAKLKKYPNIYFTTSATSQRIKIGDGVNEEQNIFLTDALIVSGVEYDYFTKWKHQAEPTWLFDMIDWDYVHSNTNTFGTLAPVKWTDSHYIKSIPSMPLFYSENGSGTYYHHWYSFSISNCYNLQNITLPRPGNATLTSTPSGFTPTGLPTLKSWVFDTLEDGTPYSASWKLTLNLSSVGYTTSNLSPLNTDKKVATAEQYLLLKDDPEWWGGSMEYSCYNHDSAVETINSLPDVSAYGTSIIKFRGISGSKTDGGAINTLTEEEIAVATAKGWTVSLI